MHGQVRHEFVLGKAVAIAFRGMNVRFKVDERWRGRARHPLHFHRRQIHGGNPDLVFLDFLADRIFTKACRRSMRGADRNCGPGLRGRGLWLAEAFPIDVQGKDTHDAREDHGDDAGTDPPLRHDQPLCPSFYPRFAASVTAGRFLAGPGENADLGTTSHAATAPKSSRPCTERT